MLVSGFSVHAEVNPGPPLPPTPEGVSEPPTGIPVPESGVSSKGKSAPELGGSELMSKDGALAEKTEQGLEVICAAPRGQGGVQACRGVKG